MNRQIRTALTILALWVSLAASAFSQVEPDKPSGSAREAELAKRAAAIFDAFVNSEAVFTRDGKQVVFSLQPRRPAAALRR